MACRKTGDTKIIVDNIHHVSGGINVAGGDIHVHNGITDGQVATILETIQSKFQLKKFKGQCPYKGLDAFEEEDANLFFGREKLVEELINLVKQSRAVFIAGPSGSGKSSLVRAGLIHALKQGVIENSERWLYETIKPGRDPLEALAMAFSRLKSPELAKYFREHINEPNVFHDCAESVLSERKDQRLVIFLDQFEEVFTQTNKEETRVLFFQMLTRVATIENGRVILLFAIRSDFISNCATYPQLNNLAQFKQIGAMKPDELVNAIAQPALHVGLGIEHELITQIINDMGSEPGALPLMQFALKDLFDYQQANGDTHNLTRSAYLQREGIKKMLAHHADETFSRLSPREQELTKTIFSGLIEIGRGTQDTKRTALLNDLIPANTNKNEVKHVLQKLANARLVTSDEDVPEQYTITHEKLIDAWPWLKKLVDENRDVIALQNEIAIDAKEWDEHKRDPSYLYTDARLLNVNEKLRSKKLVLSGKAFEYIRVGNTRKQRGQAIRFSAVLIFVIVSVLVSIVYNNQVYKTQTAEANSAANEKLARFLELASKSATLRNENFQVALLLGVEAQNYLTSPVTQAYETLLFENVQAHSNLQTFLSGRTYFSNSLAVSPDGRLLASGYDDNSIILWDLDNHVQSGELLVGHVGFINCLAFSPDGKILASGSDDKTIVLWDLETHQPLGESLKRHGDSVWTIDFSSDGKLLASSGINNDVIIWDADTHSVVKELPSDYNVWSVAFNPDGTKLAFGDSYGINLWDTTTDQRVRRINGHTQRINQVAFSPDGSILVSGSQDGTIIFWNTATLEQDGEPLSKHTNGVNSVVFSPDGKILASASDDKSIILWDVENRKPINQPLISTSAVFSVVFNNDGRKLISNSKDNSLVLWDTSSYLDWHTDPVRSIAFSPNGAIYASGSEDKTIILWDATTGSRIQRLTGNGKIYSLAFSPDGTMLASEEGLNRIRLWDLNEKKFIREFIISSHPTVSNIAFSPDGTMLASSSWNNTITLWDVVTGESIHIFTEDLITGKDNYSSSIAFSPDGKLLASGNVNGMISFWDMTTYKQIGKPIRGDPRYIWAVTFSPDGKLLASGGDEDIILWDAKARELISHLNARSGSSTHALVFSPDSKILASGGFEGHINLWDVSTFQRIDPQLTRNDNLIRSLAFSLDGKTLASGGDDNEIFLWNVDRDQISMINQACQRAGRNFTQAEWEEYFPEDEYRITCPQWQAEK